MGQLQLSLKLSQCLLLFLGSLVSGQVVHEFSTLSIYVVQTLSLLSVAVNFELRLLCPIKVILNLLDCLLCLRSIIDAFVVVVLHQLPR